MRLMPLIVAFALVAGPASADAPIANAAANCGGTVTGSIDGNQVRARSIATRNTSCRAGKNVIRRFLSKANRKPSCNRRSKRPPPTSGCGIGSFNCFRRDSTYCASPSAREISWRE